MIIRKATIDDIDALVTLRLDFTQDEGIEMSVDDVNEFTKRLRDYFIKLLKMVNLHTKSLDFAK